MRNYLYLLFLVIFLSLAKQSGAQVDPHFSQYYAYPLYLNPAFTGVMDGDYRATAIYKNQWLSIGTPYSTTGISLDMTTLADVNFGVNIFQQTAGDGGYHYTQGSFSVSYQGMHFDEAGNQRVIFGLQFGFINRRFDPTKLVFGDQWMPFSIAPNTTTAEVFSQTSATSFDAAAGIAYEDDAPEKNANVYGGFSMNHLTRPQDPFIVSGYKTKLPYRYTYYAGVKIKLDNGMIFTPNCIYMRQGNAEERMLGGYFEKPTVNDNIHVMFGGSWRYKDALVPYAGMKINNLQLGLSYDANVSTLGASVPFTNSVELSITVVGKRANQNRHYFECPPRF